MKNTQRLRWPRKTTAVLAAGITLASCGPCPQSRPSGAPHVVTGTIFGSTWQVTFGEPKGGLVADDVVLALVNDSLAKTSKALSSWDTDSEISLCARARASERVTLSPLSARVMRQALEVGEKTGGAFDVTVGPLLDVWGFSARTKGKVTNWPSDLAVEDARRRLGASLVHVGAEAAAAYCVKDREDIDIDITSVVDGAAAGEIMNALRTQGVRAALVDVAGEIVAIGAGPRNGAWHVGIAEPRAARPPTPSIVVVSLDAREHSWSLSTSGNTRESLALNGRIVGHILDPRTGRPVACADEHHPSGTAVGRLSSNPDAGMQEPHRDTTDALLSCTVVAHDPVVADAWSTACIVLGEDQTRVRLSAAPGIAALFVRRGDAASVVVSSTPDFPPFTVQSDDVFVLSPMTEPKADDDAR